MSKPERKIAFSNRIETFSYRLQDTLKSINVNHSIAIVSRTGIIESTSAVFTETTLFTQKDAVGTYIYDLLVGPKPNDESSDELKKILAEGQGFCEQVHHRADSSTFVNFIQVKHLSDDKLLVIMDAVKNIDVDEADSSEPMRGLARAAARAGGDDNTLETELQNVQWSFSVSDATKPDCPLIFVTPEFCELTGYSKADVVGKNCRFLQGPETDSRAVDVIRNGIARAEPVSVKLLNYRKDGSAFSNFVSLTPLFDAEGELAYYVGVQHHLVDVKVDEDVEVIEVSSLPQRPSVHQLPQVPMSLKRPSITDRRKSMLSDDEGAKSTKLERLSAAVEGFFEHIFFVLGKLVATHPWITIIICLVFAGAFGAGFSMYYTESRTDKLWVPQGTQTLKDRDIYEKYYGGEIRIDSMIAVESNLGNILTKPALRSAIQLVNRIQALRAYPEGSITGKQYNLGDLCVETSSSTCLILGILSKWDYNTTVLDNDTDIISTLNYQSTVDSLKSSLGKVTLDGSNRVMAAESMKVTFFLNNSDVLVAGQLRDLPAEGWEASFVDEVIKSQSDASSIKAYPSAQRSFSDVFGGAIKGDVALLSSSLMLIVAYVMVNLGRFNRIESGVLLSLGAVGSVGLAILVSFGGSSFAGFFYGPVHSVLPFILVGLGVDDALVLTSAFQRTNHMDDIKTRLSESMAHAGVSITVTSCTDLAAFLFGTLTQLPALQSFCVYASFGIGALYLFQPTFFAACLVFDARRQAARRYDCVPCVVQKNPKVSPSRGRRSSDGTALKGKEGMIANFLRNKYGPALVKNNWIRALVIVVFTALLGGGIFGFTQLQESASLDAFIPSDSYFAKTKEIESKYFGSGSLTVDIVTLKIDYFAKMQEYLDMKDQLNGTAYVKPTVGTSDAFYQSWMETYLAWLAIPSNGYTGQLVSGKPPTSQLFYQWLTDFLFDSSGGGRFESDLVVVKDASGNITSISAARVRVQLYPLPPTKIQVTAMDSLKNAVSTKVKLPAFAFTFSFLFFEQYRIIGDELRTNILSTLAAVAVITLLLIANPVLSFLVFLMVAATIVDLAGIMYLWDVKLDSVASVNLVLAVGLAVDYASHVGHNFGIQLGPTRAQRAISALGDIGAPVLNGGTSTFLAVVLLSLSNSYVFQVFFKMFFATCVMGLAHGMILLPVLLSLVAPHGVVNAEPGDVVKGDVEKELDVLRRRAIEEVDSGKP